MFQCFSASLKMDRIRTTSITLVEEEVEVKPAIELIGDEYEQVDNVQVHVFVNDRRSCKNVDLLRETLVKLGFVCDADNVHYLQEIDGEVFNQIRNNCQGLNGIIFFIFGLCHTEGHILLNGCVKDLEEIWNMFNADHCPALKNKPKIFIFKIEQIVTVARDGTKLVQVPYELVYDTPAEADILIIYKRAKGDTEEFIESLCNNIATYGDSEDVVSIFTYLTSDSGMAISTMTRRFFFVPSEIRGTSNAIEKLNVKIKDMLIVCGNPKKFTGRAVTVTDSSAGSSKVPDAGTKGNKAGTSKRKSIERTLRPQWRP